MPQLNLKMHDAALAEDGEDIVLRGVIDMSTIDAIRVDDYQRELLPEPALLGIADGFADSSVPDVDLAMRGGNYEERGGSFTLTDPVFVVDGLQRISAAKLLLARDKTARLGASLRFNTTREWERNRFRVLNMKRARVSPNVNLRNARADFSVIELLYDLCRTEEGFPLRDRVCWQQSMKREHLLTALSFAQAASSLHAHFGSGHATGLHQLLPSMQATMERVGKQVYRTNVLAFYGVMEECWGISRIVYKSPATVLRGPFLRTLSRLLDCHEDFWNEKRLVVTGPLRKKLATFPISDPTIQAMASTGGASGPILLDLLAKHLNSGRRTQRLTQRPEKRQIAVQR